MARDTHRGIIERLVVTGVLRLETPAHFGAGEPSDLTDMALVVDEFDGAPLLPGSTLAGALRCYLRERQMGYSALDHRSQAKQKAALPAGEKRYDELLFGAAASDPEGVQSWLIVHDALGQKVQYELRDGVKIDPGARTAVEDARFDYELLAAGAEFGLRFELLLPEAPGEKDRLLAALAAALDGLARGEITLGMRKRRGFGRCSVSEWQVNRYRLHQPQELLAWLAEDHPGWPYGKAVPAQRSGSIFQALGEEIAPLPDRRERLEMEAVFSLDGSLLVRSGFGEADLGPDTVHLHSLRPGPGGQKTPVPVLPGTSLAGVLRGRALRILRTLGFSGQHAGQRVGAIFGPEKVQATDTNTPASRLETQEAVIENGIPWVQNRVRIDRFTGGAFESALFNEQPVFGGPDTRMTLRLALRQPEAWEIGLLLLLLKDLWTGDLRVGGETGLGRGRLLGCSARFKYKDLEWTLTQLPDGEIRVEGNDRDLLEEYVRKLSEETGND